MLCMAWSGMPVMRKILVAPMCSRHHCGLLDRPVVERHAEVVEGVSVLSMGVTASPWQETLKATTGSVNAWELASRIASFTLLQRSWTSSSDHPG